MSDIAALVAGNLDIWTSATQRKSGVRRGGGKRISLYGIERLRALILDLAVRGKLVPQDAMDEPARELLKKFKAQRAVWISEKRIRKGKPLEKLSDDEFRFSPPIGWEWTRFGHLGDWGAGATPNRKTSSYYGGETPWFKSGELVGDYISLSEETVTELALRECSLRLNAPGDVLIAMYGATIGKTSILEVAATTNQAVCACTPFDGVFNRYLLLVLKAMRPNFIGQGAGGAQPNISREKIIATPLCLPPLAEQRRIVAKVDELMALCDALERESADAMAAHQVLVEELLGLLVNSPDSSNLAADLAANWARLGSHFDTLFTTEASIDALKQTILDLAVRGKLVEQDAGDEAASVLVKQTMASKFALVKKGKTKRDKPLPKVKTNDAPFDLPGGWTWARFPELGIFERGKSKHRPRNDPKLFEPGIYPLVQTGEVARSDGVIQEFHSEYSDIGLAQSKLWPAGTLCITIAANIADVATLGFDACFPDSVVGFIPAKPIPNPQYFLYFMKTAKADLLKFAPSTAQKNINLGILETVLIPLPPLAEQQRIVAKVDALMALCDALKARITDAATTQKHFADAIVERAAA